MNAPSDKGQQGPAAASPLALLDLKRIKTLTDAAMHTFGVLYDIERQHKSKIKHDLVRELADLDLFGLTCNKLDSEAREYGYQPDEEDWHS
jgi:hypothetical protein